MPITAIASASLVIASPIFADPERPQAEQASAAPAQRKVARFCYDRWGMSIKSVEGMSHPCSFLAKSEGKP